MKQNFCAWRRDITGDAVGGGRVGERFARIEDRVWLWGRVAVALALALTAGVVIGAHAASPSAVISVMADLALVAAAAFAAVTLAVGALRRAEWSRRDVAARAVALERQRLARDLHDGLCQDLSFIAAYAEHFAGGSTDDHPMAVAARRALAASRGVLADLSVRDATDVRQALYAVADELADRFGIPVEVDTVSSDLAAANVQDAADVEDLVRIAREAIVNAARHGHARNVVVKLMDAEGGFMLRVSDDGCGMPAAPDHQEGFGIKTMRARAAELGAGIELRRLPSGGVELEVAR